VLTKILPSYYDHVMRYTHTLLPRFYGFHRIETAEYSFYFIITESVFKSGLSIHETYDLKGSKVNRTNKEGTGILKDLDLKKKLRYGDKKKAFINQLKSDVKFLEMNEIMDYSLLVGIHRIDTSIDDNPPNSSDQSPIILSFPKKRKSYFVGISNKALGNAKGFMEFIEDTETTKNSSPTETQDKIPTPQSPVKPSPENSEDEDEISESIPIEKDQKDCPPSPLIGKQGSYTRFSIDRPPCLFQADQGGTRAFTIERGIGNEIYFVGVIDILIRYATKKKAETIGKSIIHGSETISVVAPHKYALRFLRFIDTVVE